VVASLGRGGAKASRMASKEAAKEFDGERNGASLACPPPHTHAAHCSQQVRVGGA
jgi:hypothetical protein